MTNIPKDFSQVDFDFGGTGRMFNLPDPVDPLQAVHKKYVDNLVAPLMAPPQAGFVLFEDFLSFNLGTNEVYADYFWKSGVVGTGAVNPVNQSLVGYPGQIQLTVPANGDSCYLYNDVFFELTSTEDCALVGNISPDAAGATNSQRIGVRWGLSQDITNDLANNLIFMADKTSSPIPNWKARVTSGGVPVDIDTGVPLTNSHVKLKIEFNATDLKAYFYIDDTLVATFDIADVPVNSFFGIGTLVKTTSAFGATMEVDYFKLEGSLAGGR